MRDYTDITVLLDRSGSMSQVKKGMEEGFDTFLKEHRQVPSSKLTLIQFDDIDPQEVIYQGVPIGAAERLVLRPRGNTPLLDAICAAVDNTGRRFASMSENDRPDRVLMVIITDGQENSSRLRSRRDVYERITRQRETYNWQFVYLGANQDTYAESQSFGIPWANTVKYTYDVGHTVSGLRGMTTNTVAYANSSSKAVPSFDEEIRIASATKADRDLDSDNQETK